MTLQRLHAALLATLALSLMPLAAQAGLRVDILAFNQPGNAGAEYWGNTRPLPPCHAVLVRDGGGAEAAFPGNEQCRRQAGYDAAVAGYSAGGGSAVLAAQAGKLKAKGYPQLLNRGWRQAAAGQSPVLLRGGRSVAGRQELEGTLSVGGSEKAPEVTIELVLTRMDGEQPQYVVLRETRKLKPGELNYFDHPLFGAILQVTADNGP